MSNMIVKGPVKKATIAAVVIRADGTREDLGTIAYFHKNPIKRWGWHVWQPFSRMLAALLRLTS